MTSAKAVRTNAHLLETARQILLDEGIERLRMDRLAERAGLSKGAVMYHFATKRALLAALIDDYARHMEREFARHEALFEGTPEETLIPGYVAWCRSFLQNNRGWASVGVQLLSQEANDPELLKPLRDWYARLFERIENLPEPDRTETLAAVLALEGLFYARKFAFDALDPARVETVLEHLLTLTNTADVPRRSADQAPLGSEPV